MLAMESMGSPHLPRGTSFGVSMENLSKQNGSKKYSHGFDPFDDTSSVASTSISSTTTATKTLRKMSCYQCGEREALPIKPLVTCKLCKRKYHTFCHNPHIENTKEELQCYRCLRKISDKVTSKTDLPASARSTPAPASVNSGFSKLFKDYSDKAPRAEINLPSAAQSTPAPFGLDPSLPENSREQMITGTRVACNIANCSNLSIPSNEKGLCKLHEITDRHGRIQAQQNATLRPTSGLKPFDKSKIYSTHAIMKDDEAAAILKEDKKRKREEFRKSHTTHGQDAAPDSRPKMKLSQNSRANMTHAQAASILEMSTATPKPRSKPRGIDQIADRYWQIHDTKLKQLQASQPSGNSASTVIQIGYGQLQTSSNSFGSSSGSSGFKITEPLSAGKIIPVIVETDDVLSPGSQITQEFCATVQQPSTGRVPPTAAESSVMDMFRSFQVTTTPGNTVVHDDERATIGGEEQTKLDVKGKEAEVFTDGDGGENASSENGTPAPDDMDPEAKAKAAKARMNKRKKENAKKNKKEAAAKKAAEEAYEAEKAMERKKIDADPTTSRWAKRAQHELLDTGLRASSPFYLEASTTRSHITGTARVLPQERVSYEPSPEVDPLMQEATTSFLDDADTLPPAPPGSLEAKRRARASAYDATALDAFLAKQSAFKPPYQPTPEELANNQIWGNIDPRVQWPLRVTDEYRFAMMQEIAKRGGKKANFGILLTYQERKWRKDNGFHPNQNKAIVHTKESDLGKKHLEELFGKKPGDPDLDDLVPTTLNGKLVMVEKDKPGDGKGKKKRFRRAYTIDGTGKV